MTIADDMQYIDRHRDDPCDEWPAYLIPGVLAAFVVEAIKRIIPETPIMSGILKNRTIPQGATFLFASGGTFAPDTGSRRFMPLMGESGPEAIMPRRGYGKSIYPQALRCMHGQHHWTTWGNFTPAPLKPLEPMRSPGVPPEPTKIEAYRWRYCQCGATERETYADHTVKRFNAGELPA